MQRDRAPPITCETMNQPAPKYHAKGCSRSSADSPGARTLVVFTTFEPFSTCEFQAPIARTPFYAMLWRSPKWRQLFKFAPAQLGYGSCTARFQRFWFSVRTAPSAKGFLFCVPLQLQQRARHGSDFGSLKSREERSGSLKSGEECSMDRYRCGP